MLLLFGSRIGSDNIPLQREWRFRKNRKTSGMDALNRTYEERGCYYGSGMDALNGTYEEHGCYYGSGMDALNRTYEEHGCYYGSGMDALNRRYEEHGCYYGSGMDALNRTYEEHGCYYGVCHECGEIDAMRGGSSIFGPSTGPKVVFVPRRPVPMGLGGNAFFARLRAVGAPT